MGVFFWFSFLIYSLYRHLVFLYLFQFSFFHIFFIIIIGLYLHIESDLIIHQLFPPDWAVRWLTVYASLSLVRLPEYENKNTFNLQSHRIFNTTMACLLATLNNTPYSVHPHQPWWTEWIQSASSRSNQNSKRNYCRNTTTPSSAIRRRSPPSLRLRRASTSHIPRLGGSVAVRKNDLRSGTQLAGKFRKVGLRCSMVGPGDLYCDWLILAVWVGNWMDFSCPIFFFLIFNLCVCVCVCTPTVSFFVSSARFPSLLSNPILFFLFFLQCFILRSVSSGLDSWNRILDFAGLGNSCSNQEGPSLAWMD